MTHSFPTRRSSDLNKHPNLLRIIQLNHLRFPQQPLLTQHQERPASRGCSSLSLLQNMNNKTAGRKLSRSEKSSHLQHLLLPPSLNISAQDRKSTRLNSSH